MLGGQNQSVASGNIYSVYEGLGECLNRPMIIKCSIEGCVVTISPPTAQTPPLLTRCISYCGIGRKKLDLLPHLHQSGQRLWPAAIHKQQVVASPPVIVFYQRHKQQREQQHHRQRPAVPPPPATSIGQDWQATK